MAYCGNGFQDGRLKSMLKILFANEFPVNYLFGQLICQSLYKRDANKFL